MRIILVALILVLSNFIFGQTTDTQLLSTLDDVISKSKEISLYSNEVDWDDLEMKVHLSAEKAQTIEELKPAFEILLNGLGDHHGTIRKTADYSILANFTDYKNSRNVDDRKYEQEIWNIVNDLESRFEFETLSENVGYLKLVGIGPNVDPQKEAERVRAAIRSMNSTNKTKWVLDLRYNGGGNIHPMLAGLAPLLDNQVVASIMDGNEQIQGTAEIKKGDFWYYGVRAFKMKNRLKIRSPKIAILTSRWTVSSGELVAVAFKGQKDTRFFGETTGGYTTNNSWEVINDEIALVISTGVYCDRSGNRYEKKCDS